MARLNIRDEQRSIDDVQEIEEFLGQFGIWYRKFEGSDNLAEDAENEMILEAYAEPIEKLKSEGGYVTADVINVRPDTPGLDVMLAKFRSEHWHTEDEVRFIVHGSGLFHIHPAEGPVFSIEVEKGDMINVPRGTLHWFDLCGERTIRAIRLFQDVGGWTPQYTESAVETKYEPLCFGPTYIPPAQG